MRSKNRLIQCFIILLFTGLIIYGYEKTDKIEEIEAAAMAASAIQGVENVLVVFDIDNTLLAAQHPFGSDQWFDWQYKLPNGSSEKYIESIDDLLRWLGYCYSVGRWMPPESNIPIVFKKMHDLGFKILILTSRSPSFIYATEKELLRNGMNAELSSIGISDKVNDFWKPDGFINEDEKREYGWTQNDSKFVFFQNGIFYSNGLNKGLLLKVILRKFYKIMPKAIVFADDKEKYSLQIEKACKEMKIESKAFWYTKEDCHVQFFNDAANGLKDLTKAQYQMLKNAFQSGSGDRIRYVERSIFGCF